MTGLRDTAAGEPKQGRYAESRARWDATLRTQAYGMFPVTPAWTVTITPNVFELSPDETSEFAVSIETVPGFVGSQPFNIHGFATPAAGPRAVVGGVTLYAQGS